jgi:tetratricopeptide (TPR) repeat protein
MLQTPPPPAPPLAPPIPPALPPVELRLDREHPWPGLISFSEADHAFFFGREREVAELARVIFQKTVTVFFGKSGLGKSSILRAGVSPLLRESEFVPVYVRLNYDEAAPPLEDQVEIAIEQVLAQEKIEASKPVRSETLWEYFHKKESDWWDPDNRSVNPVLIFDQFEELLTLGQSSPQRAARTAAFLSELEDLIENRPPDTLLERFEAERGLARNYDLERVDYRVVLTLREDFLADLEGLRERLRPIMFNRFRLLPMSGEQAMDVVLKPGGHLVDEDVAVRIVDFVSSSERSRLQTSVTRAQLAKRSIEPALLSVVLQELNNRRIQAGQEKITAELVGKTNPTEIFHDFYLRGLAGMNGEVREFIEDCLLTSSGARNRIAEEDALAKRGMSPEVIAKLIDRRVIHRETTGNTKWLELTHDTLADVVRADRAEHRQQRELQLAAAREAEVRAKLTRARKLVAAFAALFLLSAITLGYAFVKRTQLIRRAEQDAAATVNRLRQIRDEPPPGAPEIVTDAKNKISYDAHHFKTKQLKLCRAEALPLMADILYSNGLLKEGLQIAEEGLRAEETFASKSSSALQVAGAGSHYAAGKGLLLAGRLNEAEVQLQAALNATKAWSQLNTNAEKEEAAHVYILAKIELGNLKQERFLSGEAAGLFRQVVEELEKPGFPVSADQLRYLRVRANSGLGASQEDTPAAERSSNKADELLNAGITEHPDSLLWMSRGLMEASRKSFRMLGTAPFGSTAKHVHKAAQDAKTLYNIDDKNIAWQGFVGDTQYALGMLYQTSSQMPQAKKGFQAALEVYNRIRDSQPTFLGIEESIASCQCRLGEIAVSENNETEVLKSWRAALNTYERMLKDHPDLPEIQYNIAWLLDTMGSYFLSKKNPDPKEAISLCREAGKRLDEVPTAIRNKPDFQELAAWSSELIASALPNSSPVTDVAGFYLSAVQLREVVARNWPSPDRYRRLAQSRQYLANVYLNRKDFENGARHYQLASSALQEALQRYPGNLSLLEAKVRMSAGMALSEEQHGDMAAAADAFKVAVDTAKAAFGRDPRNDSIYVWLQTLSEWGKEMASKVKDEPTGPKPSTSVAQSSFLNTINGICATISPGQLLYPAGSHIKENRIIQIEKPQTWPLTPLIPGVWHTLDESEQAAEIKGLTSSGETTELSPSEVVHIRTVPLSFYDKTNLYEVELHPKNGTAGLMCYVRRDKAILRLDGRMGAIGEFNAKNPPRLETVDQAESYIRFFLRNIQTEWGILRIVDSSDDLLWHANTTGEQRKEMEGLIAPPQLAQTSDGIWRIRFAAVNGNTLYYELWKLLPDGSAVSVGENAAAVDLSVYTEGYVHSLRIVNDDGAEYTSLQRKIRNDMREKDWSKAVRDEEPMIQLLERNSFNDSRTRPAEIATEYLTLSWCQLHTRHFEDVLASSQAGLKFKPDNLLLETNHAHALLFLGKTAEAEEFYRKYIGQKVEADSAKTWEQTILEDFDQLEKDGLHHSDFGRIRGILKSAGH